MKFEKALKKLKKGKKIKRIAWGDKYILIVTGNLNYEPCRQIGMKTELGFIEPWVIRQVDIFSDDWEIVK